MRFLLAAFLFLSACTPAIAQPEMRSKPVQCATPQETLDHYVVANGLQVMYIGVAQVRTQYGDVVPTAIAFFADPSTGRFLLLEGDKDDVCVISVGDKLQIGVNHDEVMNLFLQNSFNS
tara:strand:+ start:3507 stop:3863 length:357 start_codon:yes stop_codon:yes gene_type:complete